MNKHIAKCNSVPPVDVAVLAVDLAKNVFQLAGEDRTGKVIYEHRIKSRQAFFECLNALPCSVTVLMETGPGAQAWARQLQSKGNPVRILPAQSVQKHRCGPKNDRNDVIAILQAGRDQYISSVPIKSTTALAVQALHRSRRGYGKRSTALSNQIRGLLMEQGITLAQGDLPIRQGVPLILEDASVPLPDMLRELLDELLTDWEYHNQRIEQLDARLKTIAQEDAVAQRLMTIRGFGPITSTALIAKETHPERFANARQFAAYFGLVPDQHSSGEKNRLGKMSKRGDGYIRSIVIQGAHAVLRQVHPDSEHPDDRRLLRWKSRLGSKEAAVRLANRNLRIAWVLLQSKQVYQRKPNKNQEASMNS